MVLLPCSLCPLSLVPSVPAISVLAVTRRSHSPCDSLRSLTHRRRAEAVPVEPPGACPRLSAWTRKKAERDLWPRQSAIWTPSRTPPRCPCVHPALDPTHLAQASPWRKAGAYAPAWHYLRRPLYPGAALAVLTPRFSIRRLSSPRSIPALESNPAAPSRACLRARPHLFANMRR